MIFPSKTHDPPTNFDLALRDLSGVVISRHTWEYSPTPSFVSLARCLHAALDWTPLFVLRAVWAPSDIRSTGQYLVRNLV